MLTPDELYTLDRGPEPGERPVLLHALTGFLDAGSVAQIVTDQILASLEHEPVARFDADRLLDYRSRRPRMVFDRDHWSSYDTPEIVVHRVIDRAGEPFLMLSGPEPDRYWEAFVGAVTQLTVMFDIRLAIGYHGVPMAVPHTRPVGHTAHATDHSLIVTEQPGWFETLDVPGSVAALLELRLGEQGRDALGFAVHVPHYLASARFADGGLHALRAIQVTSGLRLPADELAQAATEERNQIATEVAASDEVARVVTALEQQYDQNAEAVRRSPLPQVSDVDLPSADELAEQVEDFLRAQHDDDPGGPDGDDPTDRN